MVLNYSFRNQKDSLWSVFYLAALGLMFLAGVGGNLKPTHAQTSNGPTNISIGTSVQQSGVKRLGINISGQTFYDSGQMLRNLTFGNSGFEAETWKSIFTCNFVSGDTCSDGDPYGQWPANFMQGASFQFIYGSANGKTGTLLGNTIPNRAGNVGVTYNFGNVAPAVGDVFILTQPNPPLQTPDAGWWPSTSGGATITPETIDISPNSPGKQAVSLNASGSDQSAGETEYFDSFPGRTFLQLNGSYTIHFRAKSTGGSTSMNVNAGRSATAHGNETFINKTVQLTNTWQDYSYSFTASEDGTYIAAANLSFSISNGSMLLDDAYLEEAAEPDNPTDFRNAVVDRLKTLNPGVLRYMDGGNDFGSTIDNMIAPPLARVRTGYGQITHVGAVPLGLEEFLVLCQAVGAEPWYTMPAGMSPTEMQHLLEFLNGSSTSTYGAKRAALGQTAPWTSVFPMIHLELGNETWNVISFVGESFGNPYAYGSWVGNIFGTAKASPNYSSSKIDLVADGWSVLTAWTDATLKSANGHYDTIDIAPYTFNTLKDYSTNEAIFGSMFAQPEQIDTLPSGYDYQQAQVAAGEAVPAKVAVYEVNLSTIQGTAPQSIVDSTVPSVGAGIAVVEHMLLMMRDDGILTQNMFALPEYDNGFTNSNGGNETVKLWGSVIDMGGETNLCRPTFLAEQLANTAIFGNMLATEQSGNNPTWNVSSGNDNIVINGAHYIQSMAFSDGTKNSVVVFNLSRTESLPVTFSGANAPTGTVQVGRLTSANITDTNEVQSTVVTTNSTLSNFNPTNGVSLPPFSMTVYSWTPGSAPPPAANTTTTLSASPTSITAGQTVTLKATVAATNGSSTPTGNLTFDDGGSSLGTTALTNGTVTLNVSTLAAGSHSITAIYAGTSEDNSSTSNPVTVTVASPAAVSTTTTLQAPSAVTQGNTLTLTAKVTPASGSTPTGTVSFKAGSSVLGTASLSSGTATYSGTVSLATGQYAVVASYAGNSSDSASSSAASTLTVNQSVSTTTTTLQAPSSVTQGQSLTLTANVKPASGSTPTGTVNFKAGSSVLGTASLGSGTATFTTSVSLAAGQYPVVATYVGDSSDDSSSSAASTLTVIQSVSSTTTTLTAPTVKLVNGQKATVTATVAAVSGVVPTGSVSFYIDSTLLATQQLSNGVTTYSGTVSMEPGSYTMTAKYAGDSIDKSSSSAPATFTVVATTGTKVASSATQVVEGSSVALSASVTPQWGDVAATGAVTFYIGQTALGTGQLSNGQASFNPLINLPPGQYPITAAYPGDTYDEASTSDPITLTVIPATVPVISTNTTLTVTPTQLTQGQSMQLAAVVKAASGSTPTGSISFYLGQTQLGSAILAAGAANVSVTATMAPGTYQLTAVYAGTAQDSASSSAPVSITIAPSVVATTTTLISSASQLTQGQNFSLTATVAPASAQGNVNFYLGATKLGSAALSGGAASWTGPASFAPGTYAVTAVYAGTTQDSGSSSAPVSITVSAQTVTPPQSFNTITVLTVSAAQVTSGQSMMLSVTVGEQGGAAIPSGSVAFYLGQTQMGTAILANGTASLNTLAPAAGTYILTATYAGQGQDLASQSQPVTLTVEPSVVTPPQSFNTTTVLTLSAAQVTSGQSMTLAVKVGEQGGTATPSGCVAFYLGQTQMGTAILANGNATLSTLAPAAGTYTLTATYAGQGQDLASQSQPVTLTVQAVTSVVPPPPPPGNPSFTLGLSSNSVNLSKDQTASLQVLLSAVQGYEGTVQLSCSGLPVGVTCTFAPSAVSIQAAKANSMLSLSTSVPTTAKAAMMTNVTWAMQLPFSIVSMFGLFPNRRRLKYRFGTLAFLLLAISGGLVMMTGCGLTVNSITQPYQVSVTAVGANQQSQTQSFTLYVTGPAAIF